MSIINNRTLGGNSPNLVTLVGDARGGEVVQVVTIIVLLLGRGGWGRTGVAAGKHSPHPSSPPLSSIRYHCSPFRCDVLAPEGSALGGGWGGEGNRILAPSAERERLGGRSLRVDEVLFSCVASTGGSATRLGDFLFNG
jgi:hypothetical protein